MYVTNFIRDKVTVVDAKTHKIEGEISGFNKMRAISITSDGKRLFAANSGTNENLVAELPANKIIERIVVITIVR